MEQQGSHVAVIGAGIVGICSALALQEAGHRVTLIDRGEPGQATSYGNAGVISPWSCVPQAMPGLWKSIPGMLLRSDGPASVRLSSAAQYIPWLIRFLKQSSPDQVQANSAAMFLLTGDTIGLYRMLLAGTRHEHLVSDSMQIHVFRDATQATTDALGYRLRAQQGAEIERIDSAELQRLEPALSDEFKAAVVIKGIARALNPGKIGEVLAKKVQQQQGEVLQGEVLRIVRIAEQWQVKLADASISADKVVVAAGAWSAKLLSALGVNVPLAAERGYHVSYPDNAINVAHSIMDVDKHVVASSMEQGVRIAGIAEFSDADSAANPRRIKTVQTIAESLFPALRGQEFESWMGVRPSFPDSLPVIDEIAEHPGLYAAFGHSHYGLLMAPKTGRILADIVSGKPHNTDLSVFGINRF